MLEAQDGVRFKDKIRRSKYQDPCATNKHWALWYTRGFGGLPPSCETDFSRAGTVNGSDSKSDVVQGKGSAGHWGQQPEEGCGLLKAAKRRWRGLQPPSRAPRLQGAAHRSSLRVAWESLRWEEPRVCRLAKSKTMSDPNSHSQSALSLPGRNGR